MEAWLEMIFEATKLIGRWGNLPTNLLEEGAIIFIQET